ncbi:MAG: T9SS type A sorting domain-containing protein [Ignavibacteriaceae bacterium]|nr:T9SS type A sorting domain-containing protein [Ignavibacteriaceae bacterium]
MPPAQCPDVRTFYFRVTVVDVGSHESPPSNQVEARLQGGPPPKIVVNPNSNELIEYSLSQNYPNPFNPTTTIDYSIKLAGDVTLKVYDILGTEVASLVNEVKEPGNYSVEFNAANLPSGIYVYRLTTGNFVDTKKLILLK